MATLMQKDVLIKLVTNVLAAIALAILSGKIKRQGEQKVNDVYQKQVV